MKRTWFPRFLSLLLTFVMLFELLPANVWATDAEADPAYTEPFSQDPAPEAPQDAPLSVVGEVESLRTQTEKHYRLSDGSYIAVNYGMPVHYALGDGDDAAWVDIDNTLTPSTSLQGTESSAVFSAVNGMESKSFASVFTPDKELFSSQWGEYGVSMSLMQENTALQLLAAPLSEADSPQEDPAPSEPSAESLPEEPSEAPEPSTDPEASTPPETVADEETSPDVEAPEVSEDSLAPTQASEEEPLPPTESQDPTAPPTEEATQPQSTEPPAVTAAPAPSAGILQQSQAQVTNAHEEIAPLSLEDPSTAEISEQVELPRLGSSVLYPDILPGVDLQYDTAGLNIKESIIVRAPQSSYTYRFRLSLNGLTPAEQEDGSILLKNAEGVSIYEIPAPNMVDATGAFSQDVTYTISEVSDGFLLTVTADADWIHASDRVLPVTIDPALVIITTKMQSGIITNFVDESDIYRPCYGSDMYVGSNYAYHYNGYIYIATLPQIPQNCSPVRATIEFFKMNYDSEGIDKFYGEIRPVIGGVPTKETADEYANWLTEITWDKAPAYGDVEDYAELYPTGDQGKYIKWDISRSVTSWYGSQDPGDRFLAITPYYLSNVTYNNYANVAFYTHTDYVEKIPKFIVYYRNNVGIEGYYTYQNVSAGRAGTGYISDYTSQLTLANTVVSSSSNTLPFGITCYFNSANRNRYFVDSDAAGIHTVNYTGMRSGAGWKLSIQESIRQITVKTEDASSEYYVYNDADGSEHYFQKSGKSSPYEDEDGLGLSLEVDGATFRLKDKKDNVKEFYNGYLTQIRDADSNAIYLLYNNKEYSAGSAAWKPASGSANVVTKIIRINNNGSATDVPVTLFTLSYADSFLQSITDVAGRKTSFGYTSIGGYKQLTAVTFPDGQKAMYSYDNAGSMLKAYDEEAKGGVGFAYAKFNGTVCVQKVREFAATSLTAAETVGSRWHLWVFGPKMKEYRFYGPDQTSDTPDDTVVRYTFDHTGKTVNIVNFNTDRSQILGVSTASYTANSKTKTKNRLSGAAATGYLAQNLLNNSGLEQANTTGYSWAAAVSEQSSQVNTALRNSITEVSPAVKPHTGNFLMKTYIKSEKVSLTGAGSHAGMYQRVYLTGGVSYTFSAWANTVGVTRYGKDGGMLLQFRNDSGQVLASSELLNFQTSRDVSQGWSRLEVSYTPATSGWYRVYAIQRNASAFGAFDDLQLEKTKSDVSESGASTANLVQLGSFELWNGTTPDPSQNSTYWTYGPGDIVPKEDGAREGFSMYIAGAITDKRRASQVVPIYKSSDSTYILSGWAQAYSAPNCAFAADMKGDNSENKRFFGLIAKVSYTDTSLEPDYHYFPFDCNYTDWQYASGSIVPKQRGKTVSTITVTTAYDCNINAGRFDDISLVEEPAQTYTYDNEGNLRATTSTGNSDETFQYDGADLTKQVAGGYGTYEYEYHNHNMTKATNDNVSVTASYDESGNSTGTKLRKKDNTGVYLQTSATYTPNRDHTASVTDANGGQCNYTYDSLGRNTSISNKATVNESDTLVRTNYTYLPNTDRTNLAYISGEVALYYGYTNGLLSDVSRKAVSGATTRWQRYHTSLDVWGNPTEVRVQGSSSASEAIDGVDNWSTGIALAKYQYAGNNGYLSKMTYANGDYEVYTYDRYGRVATIAHYDDGNTLNYTEIYIYDGNGNTGRCKVLDPNGNVLDDYLYEYDSLGRLIRSRQVSDGETVLRTEHQYDTDNRMTGQSYQIGSQTFSEAYTYNNNDGSMTSMKTANGDNLSFSYDGIKRLSSTAAKTGSTLHYQKAYGYRTISGNQTTTQISSLSYSGFTGAPTYRYTYTANGNIQSTQTPGGNVIAYTYDTQGQLIKAVDPDSATTYNYTYDSAGNILSKRLWSEWDGDQGSLTYSYDNENWPDLLTAVNGEKISYEGQPVKSGNPIRYFNGTRWYFSWENGRQLATARTSAGNVNTSITYAYDLNGLRTEKQVTRQTYGWVKEHHYETTVVAPTCTEKGYTLHECSCGDSYQTDETPALGHDYRQTTSNTAVVYVCTRCGATRTDHTHNYTTTVVAPTCTTDGYTLHECACGYSYRDNTVAKLGHNYVKVREDTQYVYYRCSRCGATYQSPVITVPIDPKPPISEYSLEEPNSFSCVNRWVLMSTVTEEHSYLYAGSRLLRETITTTAEDGTVTTEILDFAYDAQGAPYALTYTASSGTAQTYYYITNLQGDVMKLVDGTGHEVARYHYDPYGKPQYVTGSMADVNPLQYRGYYHDADTGFYYLQSRYYDPAICRFINADTYTTSSSEFSGQNMFAYCGNNPTSRIDQNGHFWSEIWEFIKTAVSEIGNAINSMAPAYAGCGGAAVADGPLPIGDAIGLVGAVALTLGAVGYGIYQAAKAPSISISKADTKEKEITASSSPPTVIYRYGGTNPGNLTPREKDKYTGLSFSTVPMPGAAMTTIEALNATGLVYAVRDGVTHVSVRPIGGTMDDWINAGSSSIWTRAVKSVVTRWNGLN